MLSVYLNYPMSRVSAHHNPDCEHIRVHRKPEQRIRRIDMANVSLELEMFRDKQHRFESTSQWNDMWLEIDFHDRDFEEAVAHYVQQLLGKHYKRFAEASVSIHC
jgi:hypothetical protein